VPFSYIFNYLYIVLDTAYVQYMKWTLVSQVKCVDTNTVFGYCISLRLYRWILCQTGYLSLWIQEKNESQKYFQATISFKLWKVINKDEIQSLYILNRSNFDFYPHKHLSNMHTCGQVFDARGTVKFAYVNHAHLIFS